jgi:hypothetical protein
MGSNSDDNRDIILNVLLDQNKQLGSIDSKLDALDKKIDAHIIIDNAVHERVVALEASHNKMKGATTVTSLVISAIVSGIGYYFGARH